MKKLLFVCYGNVGRSQIAQAYYNHYSGTLNASSAGVDPNTPNKYPNLDDTVCQLMIDDGIDLRSKDEKGNSIHYVQLVTPEMVELADQIYVLCNKKLCVEYPFLIKSVKTIYWNIEDPYKKDMQSMKTIRDIIKEKVLEILNTLD